jgi:hypothetical protein
MWRKGTHESVSWEITCGNGTFSAAPDDTYSGYSDDKDNNIQTDATQANGAWIGKSIWFTASDVAGIVTIQAGGDSITFEVVEPEKWVLEQASEVGHLINTFTIDWWAVKYILPADVNFYRIQILELNSNCHASGLLAQLDARAHESNQTIWFPALNHFETSDHGENTDHSKKPGKLTGTFMHLRDEIRYGVKPPPPEEGQTPPFMQDGKVQNGELHCPIQQQWKVGNDGKPHNFPVQDMMGYVDGATGMCISSKGGVTVKLMYNAETTNISPPDVEDYAPNMSMDFLKF